MEIGLEPSSRDHHAVAAARIFSPESLVRAMAPIDSAIDAFVFNSEREEGKAIDEPSTVPRWANANGQARFARLVSSIAGAEESDGNGPEMSRSVDGDVPRFRPSRRYLRKILLRFSSKIERLGGLVVVEDDHLAELLVGQLGSCSGRAGVDAELPNPAEHCYVSFRLPVHNDLAEEERDDEYAQQKKGGAAPDPYDLLGIRVFPHHNDVGVRKVWEAGCCLAEYLISHPNHVRNRRVVELGAGVGLTGIVVAGYTKCRSVHMTDYTVACLENMEHNLTVNAAWLSKRGVDPSNVIVGHLEWSAFADGCDFDKTHSIRSYRSASSFSALSDADIVIAADVAYDLNVLPSLARTVHRFLFSPREQEAEKVAIFATTYRNKKTFDLLQEEIS